MRSARRNPSRADELLKGAVAYAEPTLAADADRSQLALANQMPNRCRVNAEPTCDLGHEKQFVHIESKIAQPRWARQT